MEIIEEKLEFVKGLQFLQMQSFFVLKIMETMSLSDFSFSIVPGYTSSYDKIRDSLYEKGISATYYQPGWYKELGYVITESSSHYGVCDLNGNWIIPEEYDRIESLKMWLFRS